MRVPLVWEMPNTPNRHFSCLGYVILCNSRSQSVGLLNPLKTNLYIGFLMNPNQENKLFYFEHPHPLLVEILWGWALQGDSGAGHSGVGHSRETLGLETLGLALRRHSKVGHSRETLGLGISGRLWGWALQEHSTVGHFRDTLGLGTPGMSEE